MRYGTEYAGHTPHNDNGSTICASDGLPWPCPTVSGADAPAKPARPARGKSQAQGRSPRGRGAAK